MSKARLVITALFVEGQKPAEVAARYCVHRAWVYKLKARYEAEGEAALEPRSRAPKNTPRATPQPVVDMIVRLRKELHESGLDAGADTIGWHLRHHHQVTVSRATIHRILRRAGTVVDDPKKRPKSSYLRFEADQPNETWQSDFTHYRLSQPDGQPGPDVEILTWLDDHSRYVLHCTAHTRITGPVVLAAFRQAGDLHGYPYSTLTDNGMVFTTRYSGGKGGRNHLEHELRARNIMQKNSRPNHPTTCGKVERYQQTLKKWLRAQPAQPANLTELQALLDTFTEHYNHHRPHRSLSGSMTPAAAYQSRPKATPSTDRSTETHDRVRHDKVDLRGTVTLRIAGRMHHIGIGRTYAGTDIILLVQDLHVRVVNQTTGELLRELVIDPRRDYQPTGRPPGPARTRK
jgi:transposase InsO family protein